MQAYDYLCDTLNYYGAAVIPSFLVNCVNLISRQSSIPPDQIRFLLVCLVVYPIGLLFRKLSNPTSKHIFGIIVSIWIGNFLVAHQWIHTLVSSLVSYLTLLAFGPKARHAVFAFALGYLCTLHIYRQWTDYLGWTFDVTMQMMIVIQKLSALGYNYYDGTKNPKPTEEQRRLSVSELPGILEFLGWIYMPTNFPMGPTFEFVEYRKCVNGSVAFVSADLLRDYDFLQSSSVLKIYGVSLLVALFIRFKSYRDSSTAWNIKTSLWLRRLVYDRLPAPINLYAVYFLSAFWHGFYPGYYMFFLTIGILTGVHRKIRATLRPRAIAMGPTVKRIYDVIGWLVTVGTRDYFIISFMLLELSASLTLYGSMYFFVHVLSAVAVVVFYSGIVKPPNKKNE